MKGVFLKGEAWENGVTLQQIQKLKTYESILSTSMVGRLAPRGSELCVCDGCEGSAIDCDGDGV